MQTSLQDGSFEFLIPSNLDEARMVQEAIEDQLKHNRYEDSEIFGIKLALEEAIVNAVKHGNQMDNSKKVHVHFRVNPERFDIVITDEGPGYDPGDVPDPLADENIERPSGRGLFLIRHYMTEVTVHPPGNRLTMCKVREVSILNGTGH